MPMTVLQVAYPFAPVGPAAVGGAERILGDLDEALVARGHRSVVLACEGSSPAGELIATPLPSGKLDGGAGEWHRRQFQAAFDRAMRLHPVDVVHMHGLSFHECRLPSTLPVVVTLHMPVSWYPQDVWRRLPANVQLVAVSESQRSTCGPEMKDVQVIPNGVSLAEAADTTREGFALVLGRVCPEKNMHEALDAGTRAGMRVLIGGQVFPYQAHQEYFKREIEPRLRDGHEFLGPLSPEQRTSLLQRASCLLHPTLAPETSSLVAMEAISAGTPVIAYASGALPEVVCHGRTGFLVDGVQEMADAIGRVHEISHAVCRSTARERFSREEMTSRYIALYRNLASSRESRCA